MTLHAALVNNARSFPDRCLLNFEGQQWTYAQVDALTDRIAAGLMAEGVKVGDRVALLYVNCPELVFCYYACFKIGAVAVPLNVRFQLAELVYALNHCGAKILIGQPDLCAPLLSARDQIPEVSLIFPDGAPQQATAAVLPAFNNSALATLLYTSGTTSRPKGVMHSHATLLQHNENYIATNGRDVYRQTLISLPLCHMGGFSVLMLPAIATGGTVTLLPRFDAENVLRRMSETRTTFSGALPVFLNALVNHPDAKTCDIGSLKLFVGGGDCVPLELQNRFRELFGVPVDELCGMTEVIYCMQPYFANERRPGSIGKPIGDVYIRLEDDYGDEVPQGEVGEIVIYSRAVTLGYWNDPESTEAALKGGGMHSGDLARRDADGFLWFVGRSKDIIIRGGSNIAPGEVEDVLYAHPAVYEAGVIGVADSELGQRVRAYVALKPGTQASASDLTTWASQKLAAYKVPESIVFLDVLPKGLTGKVHRKTLRDQAHAGVGT